MSFEIPTSAIGRFTDVTQAKAYVTAQATKKAVLTAGQHIAAMDNNTCDLNVEKGRVVATNVGVPGLYNTGDAMATFTPLDESATPPKKKGLLTRVFGPGVPSKPLVPFENLKSVYFSGGQGTWKQTLAMSETENGHRFESSYNNQHIVFTEDKCGNLVIETLDGY